MGMRWGAGLVLLLSTLITWPRHCHLLLGRMAANITTGNNTIPLEFAVGSNATIRCRVYDSTQHNATAMKMRISDQDLDVVVVAHDVIETTLHNVTQRTDTIQCLGKENKTLGAARLCVGNAPTQNMTVSCWLYPMHNLTCGIQVFQAQDTLCNVKWALHLKQRNGYFPPNDSQVLQDEWLPFHGTGKDIGNNMTWPLEIQGGSLFLYGNITVRATAENAIDMAQAFSTFRPVEFAVPGVVQSLTVLNYMDDPTSLLVTWNHSQDDTMCMGIGGLTYRLTLLSMMDNHIRTMEYKDDCNFTKRYLERQQRKITCLVPYTMYRVTVTPFGPRYSGPSKSSENTTTESKPLRPPAIVGWSAGVFTTDVVLYWKAQIHPYRGGHIVAYNVSVRTSQDYYFPVKKDEQSSPVRVMSPDVLKGCSTKCEINVTSSTVVGASAPASVSISSWLRGLKTPMVFSEIAEDDSRIVSWEGSLNVTSVAWCYGTTFKSDSSLIQCKTDVQERAVHRADDRHMIIPRHVYFSHQSSTCENCRWHFAVRVFHIFPYKVSDNDTDPLDYSNDTITDSDQVTSDYMHPGNVTDFGSVVGFDVDIDSPKATESQNDKEHAVANRSAAGIECDAGNVFQKTLDAVGAEYDNGRLVWNQCQYDMAAQVPSPKVKVEKEGVEGAPVVVTVETTCSTSGTHARPVLAQVVYGPSLNNCSDDSSDPEAKNVSLQLRGGGQMTGQLKVEGLRKGTVCVRLWSQTGWGDWEQEPFNYSRMTSVENGHVIAMAVSAFAVFGVVLVICLIRRFRRNVRKKCERFNPLDFSPPEDYEYRGNGVHSLARPQNIPMTVKPLSSTALPLTHVPTPTSSLQDSAFEEMPVTRDPITGTPHQLRDDENDDDNDAGSNSEWEERGSLLGAEGEREARGQHVSKAGPVPGTDRNPPRRPLALGLGETVESPQPLSPCARGSVLTGGSGAESQRCSSLGDLVQESATRGGKARQQAGPSHGIKGNSARRPASAELSVPHERQPGADAGEYVKVDSPSKPFPDYPASFFSDDDPQGAFDRSSSLESLGGNESPGHGKLSGGLMHVPGTFVSSVPPENTVGDCSYKPLDYALAAPSSSAPPQQVEKGVVPYSPLEHALETRVPSVSPEEVGPVSYQPLDYTLETPDSSAPPAEQAEGFLAAL